MEYHDRLKKVMKDTGVRNKDLIKACNVSNSAISQWRSGDSKPKDVLCIANAVGWNPNDLKEYLENGTEPTRTNEHQDDYLVDTLENIGKLRNGYKQIPIVGMAQLGDNGYFEEQQYPVGFGDGFIDTPTTDPNAYALKVVGDSMYPAIRHGWFVVIEPNLEPYNGMIALFKFKDGRKMIKELANQADGFYTLLSINEDHKRITANIDELEGIHPVAFIAPPNKVKHP